MEKKTIDIIREKMVERRKDAQNAEEEEGLDWFIEKLNENDFFFHTISARSASRVFEILGIDYEVAIKMYKDLMSNENKKKYAKYLRDQRKQKIVSTVKKFLKEKKQIDEYKDENNLDR